MRILTLANLVLLTMLSLASGIAKIALAPQEIAFFGGAGFSNSAIVVYGVFQSVGGLLLILPRARVLGAITMAITFGISTIIIFMSGKIAFGFFSILPILMAGIVIKTHAAHASSADT